MIYGMYLSTAGAKAQSYRQDVIANNIANVDTTGFRRQYITARARLDHQTEYGAPPPILIDDPRRIGGGVAQYKTYNDLNTQGPLQPSSAPSHMAIAGSGFFKVRQENETLLTRNGAFTFGDDGTLRTSDGQGEVLSTAGLPIRIDPNQPFSITTDNVVMQAGRPLGIIAVVEPLNVETLERKGQSLIAYDGRDEESKSSIMQNFLEGSNVEPVTEMVDLIEASRAFETNIQMIQIQNDTLARLVESVPQPA